MVQNIIFIVVIVVLMACACIGMWKLSKWMVIPIQIILFVLLISVVVRVFMNKENAQKLNEELKKSGIAEVEKKAVSGAVDALNNRMTNDEKTAQAPAAAPAKEVKQTAPAAEKTQKPAAKSTGEVNFVDML